MRDSLSVAYRMMRAKPVRSFLSLLGIYIGVLALVVILAIREGMHQQIEGLYRTFGAQVVFIHPGFDRITKKIGQLTLDDATRLQAVPEILSVMNRVTTEMDVRTRAAVDHSHVTGVDEGFVALYRVPILSGRSFLKDEIDRRQAVCLLSAHMVPKLFPLSDPLGATLDMKGVPMKIIGVVDWNTQMAQRTSLPEVDILVPALWLAPKEGAFISTLEVRVRPDIQTQQAVRLVRQAMARGDAEREKRYFVRSLKEFVEKSREQSDRMLASLLGIAAISLLVGGIGVANVMITSVTERTREVGIRKALGATRLHILSQFLIEAGMLSASGGLLAVVTGSLGVSVVPAVFNVSVPLVVPPWPTLGCLLLTVFIGLIAGAYPASRAAQLSPAEALRYE